MPDCLRRCEVASHRMRRRISKGSLLLMQERNLETTLRMPITRDGIDIMNSEPSPTSIKRSARLAIDIERATPCALDEDAGLKPLIAGQSNRRRLRWSGVVVTVLAGVGAACLSILFSVGIAHAGSGDLDCADFGTQEAAEREVGVEIAPGYDPNGLDADHDGSPCENLPLAWPYAAVGAYLGVMISLFQLKIVKLADFKRIEDVIGHIFGGVLLAVPGVILAGVTAPRYFPRETGPIVLAIAGGLISWLTCKLAYHFNVF